MTTTIVEGYGATVTDKTNAMTVAELIKLLQACDPAAIVIAGGDISGACDILEVDNLGDQVTLFLDTHNLLPEAN